MKDIKKARYDIWELYNINQEIKEVYENSIDEETGEILDTNFENNLRKLKMDKEVVFANLGRFVQANKNFSEMLKHQISDLQAKKKQFDDQMESVKKFIRFELPEGEKIKFPDISIGWRKSESVEIVDEQLDNKQLDKIGALNYIPKVSKTKIKEWLKENPDFKLQGVEVIKKQNIVIK